MATETLPPEEKKKPRKKKFFRISDDIDDAHLCESSRVWHAFFLDHLAQFTALDANLNMAFADEWLEQINNMESQSTDETMRDEVQEKMEVIVEKTKVVRARVDDVDYYASRAFTGEDAERNLEEFGFEKLRKMIGRGEGRWVVPSFTTRRIMQDYAAELTTAGMPANLLLDFNEALNDLGEAEVEQEYAQRMRLRATTGRIILFNRLFRTHAQVKKAASIIFRDRPEEAKLFA